MMIRLGRLGRPDGPQTGVEINYHYLSFGSLLRHLRRLPGLHVERSFAWPLTDDYMAAFTYRGHEFEIGSFFVDYDITWKEDCPEDAWQDLVRHLASYTPWRLAAWFADRDQRSRQQRETRLNAIAERAAAQRTKIWSEEP